MSLFHESIKQILLEVDKFLNETLKKDGKLSKKTQEHKQLILDKLAKFYEENPQMKSVPSQDSINVKEPDESSLTGSSRSDENEDGNYNDAGIGLIPAADLNNPVLSGFLEKKQKKGSGLFGGGKFQKRWCIVHAGNFYYFTSPKDKQQNGSFRLEGYKFRNAPDMSSKKAEKELCFELYHEYTGKRIYQFMAKSKTEYEQWQNALENEGHPLKEEDIYEEVGADDPSARSSITESTGQPDKPVVEVEPIAEDVYEVADDQALGAPPVPSSGAPPVPPPMKNLHKPQPPPPVSTSPILKAKVEDRNKDLPEPEEQDELYDDATSIEAAKKTEPPTPPRGSKPSPPEPDEASLFPPVVPPPVQRSKRPQRDLPPPPPEKKKIKLNITCKPEEDFENRYFGKWDCTGEGTNELSFKKGDIIYVLSREFDEKSWWVGELNGKFGLVPKNYLTPAYSPVA